MPDLSPNLSRCRYACVHFHTTGRESGRPEPYPEILVPMASDALVTALVHEDLESWKLVESSPCTLCPLWLTAFCWPPAAIDCGIYSSSLSSHVLSLPVSGTRKAAYQSTWPRGHVRVIATNLKDR
jgi:hypothetical protein